ncbi:MAG: phytanoyl-CoA dioxygenase family protein [Roseitalea sp.]|jgi:ectoine hydroxylase-related dioxygenase (phytanoyl-CoA dioxygenase family)|nr:phytanoyl-CoA dioxygenase family protein [Roseitalea sp.]MBO6722074.1 phytanoyl-CoA dioxygenase family protein [Roseitalea sp.]MBO6741694.1 phytanoyl-CoA dioxygenase family protein [Roseitalea sp.]
MLVPTRAETRAYEADGYFIRKDFLNEAEVADFRDAARQQLEAESRSGSVMEKGDKAGNKTLLKLWNHAGDDKYGMLARDERLVRMSEALIGDEIYLYSHKMTMKQPREGGAWEWHQDFGYWYNNGCLSPEMLSIWIALDASNKANGCLQVLKGSHILGRLNHVREDGQTNVEKPYLDAAIERFDHVYVEMDPGDALVFHCNLLHRSDANNSDTYRWGYICSYNAAHNAPFVRARDYGNYEELKPVAAGSFMDAR